MKKEITLDYFFTYEKHSRNCKRKKGDKKLQPPRGWKYVKLKEIAKIIGGGTPRRNNPKYWKDGNIPWLTPSELEGDKVNYVLDTKEKITKLGLEKSNAKIIPLNSVILTCTASVGKVAINKVELTTNQQFNSFVCDRYLIIPEFLAYYFLFVKEDIKKLGGETTFRFIRKDIIGNFKVPLPALDVQRRIVTRIEELMSRIEQAKKLREEALKDTEKIMQAALHQAFKKVENYGFKTLSEVCEINPPRKEIKNLPEDLEVSFVPMNAVNEVTGEIKNSLIRTLKDVKKGYTYFREGDVLFAKITPCMENGKAAIAKNLVNGIGFGSTEFHVLRPLNEVTPEWIFHFIRQKSFRKIAARYMTGSVGQQRVPKEFLEKARIPVPSISLQKSLTNHLNRIKRKIEYLLRYQKSIDKNLEVLTHVVLKKAFSGKL